MPEDIQERCYSYKLTKEKIKEDIDNANNYEELYNQSINILQKIESSFRWALVDCWLIEENNRKEAMALLFSRFDDNLDLSDPITIFEQKWVELLQRAKNIEENNRVLKASVELTSWALQPDNQNYLDREKEFQDAKEWISNELYNTYLDAIKDVNEDIKEDWILNHINNIDFSWMLRVRQFNYIKIWKEIFEKKEKMTDIEFDKYIKWFNDIDLFWWTFNIDEWSWAFEYCYGEVKRRIWNKNLFSVIDSFDLGVNEKDILKLSCIGGLISRKKIDDLKSYLTGYPNHDNLINTLRSLIKKNDRLKMWFLISFEELKGIELLKPIIEDLEHDPKIGKILESKWLPFENVDIFNSREINALMLYDNEWHWGWSSFFGAELEKYKSKNFVVEKKESTIDYEKVVLKKWKHKIVMLKINCSAARGIQDSSKKFVGALNNVLWKLWSENFNLFALRWHCYTTEHMAKALWNYNMVWEWDILIDGWCYNAKKIPSYHKDWLKWLLFGYIWQWRWACTDDFLNRLITAVDSWGTLDDVLSYYNNYKWNESTTAWYFASKVSRPDSIYNRYYCTD